MIRRDLHALEHQHAVTIQQRDLVALDALHDESAAMRYRDLDDTADSLLQRISVLTSALPHAEAREQQAAEQAAIAQREQAMVVHRQRTEEARRIAGEVCAGLPDGPTLTALRDRRDRLAAEAR